MTHDLFLSSVPACSVLQEGKLAADGQGYYFLSERRARFGFSLVQTLFFQVLNTPNMFVFTVDHTAWETGKHTVLPTNQAGTTITSWQKQRVCFRL